MIPTLKDYYDMLERHDWYYHYSDDGRVYEQGQRAHASLLSIANASAEHKALFEAYSNHMFTGDPWKTERAPKPARPE